MALLALWLFFSSAFTSSAIFLDSSPSPHSRFFHPNKKEISQGAIEGFLILQVLPVCVMGECFRGKKSDSPRSLSRRPFSSTSSLMDNLLGLLRIRVKRGLDLAVRDVRSSDPYVVVKMGKQKFKTRVIRKCVNPEWNEDLTLSVTDPNLPVKLTVYDHDTFSKDDKMGEAEFSIIPFLEALKMKLNGLPSGTVVSRIQPGRQNCFSEESCIVRTDGNVVQDMCLRLKNVERGEVEIRLQWIDVPGAKGLSGT